MTSPRRHLFFCREYTGTLLRARLPHRYAWNIWRPKISDLQPPHTPREMRRRFRFRAAMHQARFFRRGHYGELVIYCDGELVHHTGFAARYWRFPFLRKDDLQIATSWTSPEHRDQGLAEFAVEKIIGAYRKPGRRFWFCVEDSDVDAIRVAEKTGFSPVGTGKWVVPFGVELLSYYQMLPTHPVAEIPAPASIPAATSAVARV
jgi:RimJ/RimL family protein N-acetyltransferase